MSDAPLDVPENFRAYARTRDADVRVVYSGGDDYPASWSIVVLREKKLDDGRFFGRYFDVPDDVEVLDGRVWSHELDLLDAQWERDMEERT